jgi:hypothetical protein
VLPEPVTGTHRTLIIALVARYRVPAIYPYRFFATNGGLMAYGVKQRDLYRRAASYVDRILKGEKAGDLKPLKIWDFYSKGTELFSPKRPYVAMFTAPRNLTWRDPGRRIFPTRPPPVVTPGPR